MRVAIVGDIHGNWEALKAVHKDIIRQAVDEVWCDGDVVGYGYSPLRCLDWVVNNCKFCLRGNHEQMVLDALDDPNKILEYYSTTNDAAQGIMLTIMDLMRARREIKDADMRQIQGMLEYTTGIINDIMGDGLEERLVAELPEDELKKTTIRQVLSKPEYRKLAAVIEEKLDVRDRARDTIAMLRRLRPQKTMNYRGQGIIIAHDNTDDPGSETYMLTQEDRGYDRYVPTGMATDAVLTIGQHPEYTWHIVGHSHNQKVARNDYANNIFVNPGTVGMQRKKLAQNEQIMAEYAIINFKTGEVSLRKVPYDLDKARAEMTKAGLPDKLGKIAGDNLD